jgi:hypothetical protein
MSEPDAKTLPATTSATSPASTDPDPADLDRFTDDGNPHATDD